MDRAQVPTTQILRSPSNALRSFLLAVLVSGSAISGVYAYEWLMKVKQAYVATQVKTLLLDTPIRIDVNEKRQRMGANLNREDLERALFIATTENQQFANTLDIIRNTLPR